MNKATLAETIAERTGMSRKQADDFLESFVEVVTDTMVGGDTVTIAGFGAFIPKYRSARMGVNPQAPSERMEIPAVWIPKFKAGKGLKDALKTRSANDDGDDATDDAGTDMSGPAAPSTDAAPMGEDSTAGNSMM